MLDKFSKISTLIIMLVSFFTNNKLSAQQNYKLFTGPYASINKDYDDQGKNVIGTPYLNVNFFPAFIGDSRETVEIRYDAYLDKIEALKDEKVYEIPRSEDLSTFKFKGTNIIMVYSKENNGYFFRLVDGKNQLLKREKIKIQVVKSSIEPNSLIKDGYSKFERMDAVYFIQTNQNLVKLTKKVDELINALPADLKESAKNYIKSEKIKLKNEPDLIKLVTFLNK